MSKRAAQIASEIHRAAQAVLDRGLQDPRASGALLTITDVRVSEDLRNATLLVSVMPESRGELAMHGLRSAARHIRRQVGVAIDIRQMPELAFKLDKSVKKQLDVLGAIAKAAAEREAQESAGEKSGWAVPRPAEPSAEDPGDPGEEEHPGSESRGA
jgi:ribosome-binding factor A